MENHRVPINAPDELLAGVYAAAEVLIRLAKAQGTALRQDLDAPLDGSHARPTITFWEVAK